MVEITKEVREAIIRIENLKWSCFSFRSRSRKIGKFEEELKRYIRQLQEAKKLLQQVEESGFFLPEERKILDQTEQELWAIVLDRFGDETEDEQEQ